LDIGENSIHTLPLTLSRFVSLIVKLKLDGNPLIFPPVLPAPSKRRKDGDA